MKLILTEEQKEQLKSAGIKPTSRAAVFFLYGECDPFFDIPIIMKEKPKKPYIWTYGKDTV